MRSRSSVVAALVALPLLAGACSSDDDNAGGGPAGLSPEAQAYADAWARTLTDDDGFGVRQADADCMAEAMMAELGVEVFREHDVEPADIKPGDDAEDGDDSDNDSPGELLGAGVISEQQTEVILDGWDACIDLATLLAEGLADELDLDEDGQACLTERLGDGDLVRESLEPSFTSGDDEPPPEVLAELIQLFSECAESADGVNPVIASIADELAADGTLTAEQAQCVAQAMVDEIGLERLMELGAEDLDFDDADPAVQQEMAQAVVAAAGTCGVPLSELSG